MAETITIDSAPAVAIGMEVTRLTSGGAMVIDTDDLREIAVADIASAQAMIKRSEETRTSIVRPLNETVARINALFKPGVESLERFIREQKAFILTYDQDKQRKAEAERRAREAALAQERARMEAEAKAKADEAARREREEQEAAQRAEQLRVSAEIAAAQGDGKAAETATQAAIEEERKAAEARASRELAEAQAASTAAAAAMATAPVPAGLARAKGTTKRWKWEVTDKLAAIKFIAANPAYLHVVEIDSKVMNQMATAMKDTFPVDGIRVYAEAGLTVRGAA